MSEAAVNHFKADLRAIQFTLYEHLKVQQVFDLESFAHISRDECDAIIEQCHDDDGIIWPQPVAPFLVHIVALNYAKSATVRATADRLLNEFEALNIETLLDDRDERPGVKFADADLIGIPHRVVIGERNLKAGEVEYRTRRSPDTLNVTVDTITAHVRAALAG